MKERTPRGYRITRLLRAVACGIAVVLYLALAVLIGGGSMLFDWMERRERETGE